MPHHCAVPGCTSNSKTAVGVSFHKFPADAALRRLWVKNIRRDERKGAWSINSSTRVCSLHFAEESYNAPSRKRERRTTWTNRILKVTAVPTVFDCFPERLQPTSSKRKAPVIREALEPKQKRKRDADVADCREDTSAASQDVEGEREDNADTSAGVQHEHCDCVEALQGTVESLQREVDYLQSERIVEQAKETELLHQLEKERARRDFCIDRFKGDNRKMRYYTGFLTYGMFMACFDFLLQSAKEMRTWQGKRTSTGERTTEKTGPKSKLPLQEQFFLVMVRLRLGLNVEDLADRFYINPSTVSRIFTTWINLMYVKFKELPLWMSRSKVDKWMPPCFKKWYPTTRVIIDGTEFYIEKPSSLARQSATWSSYKNHNTFKVLVGISPDGTMVYISHLYEGSMSDVDLVQLCVAY